MTQDQYFKEIDYTNYLLSESYDQGKGNIVLVLFSRVLLEYFPCLVPRLFILDGVREILNLPGNNLHKNICHVLLYMMSSNHFLVQSDRLIQVKTIRNSPVGPWEG